MAGEALFPDIITALPHADVPLEGVRAFLLQGEERQIVFVEYDVAVEAPLEAHEAQWVVVLAGEVELALGGETATYRRGDTYYIPAEAPHRARVAAGTRLQNLFDRRDRYRPK
jgi:quercetin dioxygenase-like cupin family protein